MFIYGMFIYGNSRNQESRLQEKFVIQIVNLVAQLAGKIIIFNSNRRLLGCLQFLKFFPRFE